MGIDIIDASGALHGNVECLDAIDMMMEASSFVCDTLNDVLSMNKIEEGKMVFELAPFDIRAMISRVVMVANGQASTKNLRILVNIDPLLNAHVVSDRFRIEHVLANLISNAIKFSRPNTVIGVDVEVVPSASFPRSSSDTAIADLMSSNSTSSTSSNAKSSSNTNSNSNDGSKNSKDTAKPKSTKSKSGSGSSRRREKREKVVLAYRFTVSDHGPGITDDDIAKLFKPFSQINPSIIQVGFQNLEIRIINIRTYIYIYIYNITQSKNTLSHIYIHICIHIEY
jgi:signal transduction histidine kinase